ncbi:MAG: hypothetical protein CVU05_05360 [Bacteroidetes bacterium HGW-Bacteroidetes-21]|nr:MAG: hypothetical protein CVU05_05360 [Bacteroidetes bacterium HGW-Bacteroidetes-21]
MSGKGAGKFSLTRKRNCFQVLTKDENSELKRSNGQKAFSSRATGRNLQQSDLGCFHLYEERGNSNPVSLKQWRQSFKPRWQGRETGYFKPVSTFSAGSESRILATKNGKKICLTSDCRYSNVTAWDKTPQGRKSSFNNCSLWLPGQPDIKGKLRNRCFPLVFYS